VGQILYFDYDRRKLTKASIMFKMAFDGKAGLFCL